MVYLSENFNEKMWFFSLKKKKKSVIHSCKYLHILTACEYWHKLLIVLIKSIDIGVYNIRYKLHKMSCAFILMASYYI